MGVSRRAFRYFSSLKDHQELNRCAVPPCFCRALVFCFPLLAYLFCLVSFPSETLGRHPCTLNLLDVSLLLLLRITATDRERQGAAYAEPSARSHCAHVSLTQSWGEGPECGCDPVFYPRGGKSWMEPARHPSLLLPGQISPLTNWPATACEFLTFSKLSS